MPNLATPTQTPHSYSRQDWKRGYESQCQESAYWLKDIEGEIPPQLEGTLFRNGPGLLDINGSPFKHPFDGDGMICAFSFCDGRVHFRNRFVRTQAFLEEQAAGEILYRGVFGTQKPGGWWKNFFDLRLKNIANTNIIYWGGKLLALWEAAEPYRLDPETLETEGLDLLDGTLKAGGSFSAHPRIDPECEQDGGAPCLVNFSVKAGFSSQITIYEFDPQGKLLRRHEHTIPGFAFMHDFAITPNYCIFLQNPVKFNPFPYLLGQCGAGECISFDSKQPTRIILIPRKPPYKGVQILEAPSGFVFHHANAFELEGDRIGLDSICYDSLSQIEPDKSYKEVDFDALSPGQLWRFTLSLKEKTVESQLLEPRACEFPALHPDKEGRPYRYLYSGATHHPTGNAPLQGILKLDLATGDRNFWSAAPRGFLSEPVFVPNPEGGEEDEGWLLAMVYDASHHRSDLVILEASDVDRGPIARLHLNYHIPYGLHGSWTSECFIP
ncbi:MAG: carotenoid oxygenase family protein [Cyanobacteriota bacterium]|nr:carotenoid oxygenase family protein [Cyanobacteriota bacterium]